MARPIRSLTAILIASALAAPAAMADSAEGANISGNWTFQAHTYDGCDFGGVTRLTPADRPNFYDCELTARQVCPALEIEWVVRQSCIAERNGDRLTIRSEIEEFLVGEPSQSYWPDNFILTVRSDSRMTGSLISHGAHPAEFIRQAEGIS